MPDGDKLVVLVGKRIRQRRMLLGLTQAQLAEMIGVQQDAICRMELGLNAPRFSRLPSLAQSLQCEVVDLFYDSEDESLKVEVDASMIEFSRLPPEVRCFALRVARDAINTMYPLSRRDED